MTASQFTIEEIQANTVTPEGRAFKACLDIARRGTPTSFKLVVNETITAKAYPFRLGNHNRLWNDQLV